MTLPLLLMPVASSDYEKQGPEKGKGDLKDLKHTRTHSALMDMMESLGTDSIYHLQLVYSEYLLSVYTFLDICSGSCVIYAQLLFLITVVVSPLETPAHAPGAFSAPGSLRPQERRQRLIQARIVHDPKVGTTYQHRQQQNPEGPGHGARSRSHSGICTLEVLVRVPHKVILERHFPCPGCSCLSHQAARMLNLKRMTIYSGPGS